MVREDLASSGQEWPRRVCSSSVSSRTRVRAWAGLDDKGMPKNEPVYVKDKLVKQLKSGLIPGSAASALCAFISPP